MEQIVLRHFLLQLMLLVMQNDFHLSLLLVKQQHVRLVLRSR
jgi:hypothetical protein